jgi:hypothetical protein
MSYRKFAKITSFTISKKDISIDSIHGMMNYRSILVTGGSGQMFVML